MFCKLPVSDSEDEVKNPDDSDDEQIDYYEKLKEFTCLDISVCACKG